jgi:predicted RNase H-like nuclease (RuvC/YqgF family)
MDKEKDIKYPEQINTGEESLEAESRISLMEKIVAKIEGTLEQLDKRVSRIEEDLRSLRAEVKEEIRRLDEKIDEKIEGLRTEVKEDIRKLDEKTESLRAEVKENFKWTIVIMIGGFIAVIATSIILKLLLG